MGDVRVEYLAHTSGARVQTLLEHLEGTAELAERFGAAFGSGDFARMTALAHDLGKYSSAFQCRLRGDPGRVDHSTFGAQAVRTVGGLIPAYCVSGHHGGLTDSGGTADTGDEPTLYGRLRRKGLPDCGAYQNEITLSAAKPWRC
ncbi:CRISPR-associated endonuclease Cas3'' [Intestinimonas butyriciproducens]|uniref:CRISPR-associated endonuclease Cas3'' n=1 Tax=Intestinimonas butyriciproducens TaxID=1297617 RepID=UPI0018ABC638|nr:CRISPR-associated endonuclease Cas3'' [Intestinimonas butyriciproducens]MDB7818098.1 CRISPR-associated endonuclease Cas3'' [Intestinimonas butyriciproducens]MDB7844523.1 CRISPR-associated endonuclease Cas3'' [Intestinimonas butyriciproducens]MDB7859003.1 CRISPR-associated endonuclease Cas3'' [Intestinimonas butyriciproducens]